MTFVLRRQRLFSTTATADLRLLAAEQRLLRDVPHRRISVPLAPNAQYGGGSVSMNTIFVAKNEGVGDVSLDEAKQMLRNKPPPIVLIHGYGGKCVCVCGVCVCVVLDRIRDTDYLYALQPRSDCSLKITKQLPKAQIDL